MQIDFIADVVCPWCYLGWRRLEKALAMRPDLNATITWRPYQLDPTLPEEGVDRRNYMAAKFPNTERRAEIGKVLDQAAAEDGITWNLTDIPVSPNTNAALSPPTNGPPITKACASPFGTSCTAYENAHPNCDPSPNRCRNCGKSCGVEMINTSRIPASNSVERG